MKPSHISSGDLEIAHNLRRATKYMDREIRAKMFPERPPGDLFGEIESEPVLGDVEPCADPLQHKPISQYAPIRRLLSRSEEQYFGDNLPTLSGQIMAMRRKLVNDYVDELAHDVEMLWETMKMAATFTQIWDPVALWTWRAEAYWLLGQLTTAALLHGLKFRRADKIAEHALNALEAMTIAARQEISRAIPEYRAAL